MTSSFSGYLTFYSPKHHFSMLGKFYIRLFFYSINITKRTSYYEKKVEVVVTVTLKVTQNAFPYNKGSSMCG